MQDNMGIAEKVRGGNGRWTIRAPEMRYKGYIRDRDTGKW